MHPSELRYSPEHMWLKTETDGRVRLGITYYFQDQLKNIVYIELPEVGTEVTRAEPFGSIESSKTTSDLLSPLSGRVAEANTSIMEKPGLINKDPYGQGWLLIIEPGNSEELKSLLSAKEYLALTDKQ